MLTSTHIFNSAIGCNRFECIYSIEYFFFNHNRFQINIYIFFLFILFFISIGFHRDINLDNFMP